jgi:hypothetical protein
VGAFIGGRLAPVFLEDGSSSPYAPMVALAGALLIGGMIAVVLEAVGQEVRHRFVRDGASAAVDGVGGAALLAALALGMAWVVGAVALHTPGAKDVRKTVQRSAILQGLNDLLPPSGPILNTLNRIDPTPIVKGPAANVGPPDAGVARDPDVDRAGDSVVRVLGTACGLGIEGSGWMAAPDLVVTNAHVIAGEDDTTVTTRAGGEQDAVPVHYEPRNDIAVLRVNLDLSPIGTVSDPKSGTGAAILGYPNNGPFNVAPARLGTTQPAISQDSYGRGPIRRKITAVRGRVRSGNSGGPVVDSAGRALGTMFAASTKGRPHGFAVPNSVVRRALSQSKRPVDTGPCTR